jgi:predicted amidohydrolase
VTVTPQVRTSRNTLVQRAQAADNGFVVRLLLTSLRCPKGEIAANLDRHLALLDDGAAAGCDLMLLPEMSLTGYLPSAAVDLAHPAVAQLVAATASGPHVCFGLAERPAGDALPCITHVVAGAGRILATHRKAFLGEGEPGVFEPGLAAQPFVVAGTTCALAVCAEIGTSPPYASGADLVLGPAAPGLYGDRRVTDTDWRRGFEWWRGSVLADGARLLRAGQQLAVSTQAGATSDEDFPGWAGVVSSGGRVVAELSDWREGRLIVDLGRGE